MYRSNPFVFRHGARPIAVGVHRAAGATRAQNTARRSRCTRTPTRAAAQQQEAAAAAQGAGRWRPCEQGERMRAWLLSNGGHMDPRLVITSDTPSGSRGVVATAPIPAASGAEGEGGRGGGGGGGGGAPLRVPEALYMTAEEAAHILQARVDAHAREHGGAASAAAAAGGGGPLASTALSRLALLLAHERSKGRASKWWPYIESLPAAPPAAWLLPAGELRARLAALAAARRLPAGGLAGWEARVLAAGGVARCARAAALAAAYGGPLRVCADDVAWAMAHVTSRAFGGGDEVALAPVIDSCNHRGGAGKPWPLSAVDAAGGGGGGSGDRGDGDVLVCITPELGGAPLALAAGDELCISYGSISAGEDALSVFLSFGFVPPEVDLAAAAPGA
ncbi:MAG: hypothetical protein J3K34DRAFT_525640 [Monoraphidium minutum]|nr:MAG: hypothetical protein J3K34DRAFT_525640 [Monoraphidium minutum]